ncbi:hypothetical protein [Clostridium sp. UBA3061]|uniref:hypothetical protein n=2 Tax=unclassified Clostridium TaxID=2614128 RepID=UPI003216F61F
MKMRHKNKIKIIISLCLSCVLLLFICYRYYKMNFGVPQKFKNEVFMMDDQVKLDSTDIKITDCKLTNNKSTNIISINLYIKNTSNKDVNINDLIYQSKTLYKDTIIEVPYTIEGNEDNIVKYNDEKNITLSYIFPYEAIDDNIKFYPGKQLYEHQIKDYIENHLLMYEKSIEINCEDIKK